MVTIDIPKELNKQIEHYKIEHELKDKRDAIRQLLQGCMANLGNLHNISPQVYQFRHLFREVDKTKRHNLTPKQIEAMDSDIYD